MAEVNAVHKNQNTNFDSPASRAEVVVPSDTVALTRVARALYVGVSGNIAVVMKDGTEVTFVAVPVGIFPVSVSRVDSTSTTATNMIALY